MARPYGQPRVRERPPLGGPERAEEVGSVVRSALVGILLLLGLMAGLCLEPDSGTAASVGPPDITGQMVGANHAKPLPRLLSVTDILRLAAPALLLVMLVLRHPVWSGYILVERADPPPPGLLLGRAHARRGPPAFA